jgi:hypothetical protein
MRGLICVRTEGCSPGPIKAAEVRLLWSRSARSQPGPRGKPAFEEGMNHLDEAVLPGVTESISQETASPSVIRSNMKLKPMTEPISDPNAPAIL